MKALIEKLANLRAIEGISHAWYMIDTGHAHTIHLGISYHIDSLSDVTDMHHAIRKITGYGYSINFELMTKKFVISK